MKRYSFLPLFIYILLLYAANAERITIAVSANMGSVISALNEKFCSRYPDIEVRTVLGSSGKLTAQIEKGAPYGLFLSADRAYPETLLKKRVAIGEIKIYAKGAIVLFSAGKVDLSKGMELLKEGSIERVVIPDPATAPYGRAALEALEKAGLYEKVASRLLYAQSVSQSAVYVTKAADIGIVAKSILFSAQMRRFKKGRDWVDIDPSLYTPIEQGAVLLKRSLGVEAYAKYYDFLSSPQARSLLEKYGYILPRKEKR